MESGKKTDSTKNPQEDLRDYYITPSYLKRLRLRTRYWTFPFIQTQLAYFKKTIPAYPEVHEILETELHTRELNELRRLVHSLPNESSLRELLRKYKDDSDYREVIEIELEIRKKPTLLQDKSNGKDVRVI